MFAPQGRQAGKTAMACRLSAGLRYNRPPARICHARFGHRQDQIRWTAIAGPVVILVEPQLGENIGAAARAMANFGLTRLRLVKPRDGWPNINAERAASGADEVLDRAELFDTLEAAIADCHFVLATTARAHDQAKPVVGPREAAPVLAEADRGRRDRGDAVRPRALGPGPTRRSRSPTASSPFRSILPSPRSISRRRCC